MCGAATATTTKATATNSPTIANGRRINPRHTFMFARPASSSLRS
jgi:hypothetical protein